MKHILFILLAAAGIATSLPSCEKWEFLEEHPKKVDATTFMSNAAEVQSVINSIYYQLRRQVGFGRYLSVLSESLADYCYGRGNYATSYATGLTSGGVSFTNDTWAVLYRAIRFSNEILSQIGDAKLSQIEYDHLSGEARFLRAFSYSYLARYYGAVPFFDEHNMHDFNKPRTPERDIWEFVAREAADAAALLPESVAQAGRPARYAALMLETEALLYLERWSEAAAAVGEVIDSDRYGLVEVSKADDYEKIYGTTANATREEIFYFKYNQDDGNNFMSMYLCRPNPVRDGGNVGIYTDYEKNLFVKGWDKADLRYQYNLWIQTGNGTLNSLTKTGMICLKFRDYNSTGAANDFPRRQTRRNGHGGAQPGAPPRLRSETHPSAGLGLPAGRLRHAGQVHGAAASGTRLRNRLRRKTLLRPETLRQTGRIRRQGGPCRGRIGGGARSLLVARTRRRIQLQHITRSDQGSKPRILTDRPL